MKINSKSLLTAMFGGFIVCASLINEEKDMSKYQAFGAMAQGVGDYYEI